MHTPDNCTRASNCKDINYQTHSDYNLNIPLSKLRLRSTERISADTGKNGVYTLNRSLFLHRANAEQHIEFSQPSSFFISLVIPVCIQNIQWYLKHQTGESCDLNIRYCLFISVCTSTRLDIIKDGSAFTDCMLKYVQSYYSGLMSFPHKWMCFIIFSPLLFFILYLSLQEYNLQLINDLRLCSVI